MAVVASGNYSEACTKFTESLRYEDIPSASIDMMKICLLDWLGCVIGGYTKKHADPAKAVVRTMAGAAQASTIGEKNGNTILNAAFFHGFLGHILEMDDVDKSIQAHPATVVIPAALAVGEWKGKNGKDLLAAIVAGYEVMSRVGGAMNPRHYEIWHTTGTAGTFGAAMAAGKLFDLKRPELDWALGNAGTMAAGLWQFLLDGGASKFLHAGRAAENGVLAAFMSTRGFAGATRILEGRQGFFAGYARQETDPAYFDDFGSLWRSATISIKPYPCCRHTHSSIDAADNLRAQANGRAIRAVRARTYSSGIQVAGIEDPLKPQEGKFSLKFIIARTLLGGLVSEKDFTAENLKDPATRAMMAKIDLAPDADIDAGMPDHWAARMEADLEDGTTIGAYVADPKGDPENPVDWAGIVRKVSLMCEEALDDKGVQALSDACGNVENMADVGELVKTINRHWKFGS